MGSAGGTSALGRGCLLYARPPKQLAAATVEPHDNLRSITHFTEE